MASQTRAMTATHTGAAPAGTDRRQPRPAPAVPALAARRRPCRTRSAGETLHAARTQPDAPLRTLVGALRGPPAGRLARPAEGDRPLRRRARAPVPVLRGAHDPRRDAPLLPRLRLGHPRAPRRPGARAEGPRRTGAAGQRARPRADGQPARRVPRDRHARTCSTPCRRSRLTRRSRSTPPGRAPTRTQPPTATRSAPTTSATSSSSSTRPSPSVLGHIPPRERLILQMRYVEDLTQTEIAERSVSRRCRFRGCCVALWTSCGA